MVTAMQTTSFPRIGTQQATAMQSMTLPAQTGTSLDITALMNLMITMMIIVMMMKMMTGAMSSVR